MEKKTKVKSRGVKKGETPSWQVGRKAGREKTATFLGARVTPEEKEKLNSKLKEYCQKNNINRSGAIKKIFLEIV